MNKVVIEALKSIKNRINMSTGFVHPDDKASTIELLQLLKLNGYTLDPVYIERWALQNDFNSENAKKLREFVDGVNANKGYKTGKDPHWNEAIVTLLEERANNR
ncbi:hypothetical protein ACQKNX_05070 [Lysinibacillus sp. NPDC093712]|uniref:hypothetical protein n=1 Tax=Lysinibacillus sp. NPDC093712 TaxID=3390579 RepID=UPI003D031EE9